MDSDYDANDLYEVDKMSLEETKENIDRRRRAFEYEKKNRNDMTRIHNNEVNNISECNLLHDIINTTKRSKQINSHYYYILHGCMNTRKDKAKFKKHCILLDSEFSSTIVMGSLVFF